jgi:cyclopropane fatty-acyl-phospholipid synthase-like methyltransferase
MLVVVLVIMLLIVAMGIIAAVMYLLASVRNAVPAVFTPLHTVGAVIKALNLPEQGTLVDLGCGDGRILLAAVKSRPKLHAIGIENNPVLARLARWRVDKAAQITVGQIEQTHFNQSDRVFAYLGTELMANLEPKFARELPKGARVVSQQFPLPNRHPNEVVELRDGRAFAKKLYLYDY